MLSLKIFDCYRKKIDLYYALHNFDPVCDDGTVSPDITKSNDTVVVMW